MQILTRFSIRIIMFGRKRPTYADIEDWKRIFGALPPNVLDFDAHLVEEEWAQVGEDYLIHLDRWRVKDAKAKFVMVHGAGGNGRLLAPYCQMLGELGCEAIAPDLPGYGCSQQRSKSQITYETWRVVLSAVVEKEAAAGKPVIVFGLSMGGMLAYDVTCRTKIPVGLVASCLLDPGYPQVKEKMGRWPWVVEYGLPLLNYTKLILDNLPLKMSLVANMSSIANNKKLVDAIIADPRAGGNWMYARFLRSYLDSRPEIPPEDFEICPVLLAHPQDDKWTPVDISKLFFSRLIKVETRLTLLEGAGHFPVESPGFRQLKDCLRELIQSVIV